LLRVRDEIRMSIAAYQTLYESSVAFGMRKALQEEQGKTDMEIKVNYQKKKKIKKKKKKKNLEKYILSQKNFFRKNIYLISQK